MQQLQPTEAFTQPVPPAVTPPPSAAPMPPPPSALTVQPAPPESPAAAPADAEALAKARDAMREKMGQLQTNQAGSPAPGFQPPPIMAEPPPPSAPTPLPSADAEAVAKAREAERQQMESVVAQTPPETAAGPLAMQPNPPRRSEFPSLNFPPLQGPPPPISPAKQKQLDGLLQLYRADQITPEQYQAQRAKILGEPQ